ncbi:MAG: hypothetical protein E6J42_00660 [Chloroflexi bacterium]|nr:MAG: hypothetical protein E6J42_00660 [Chloroflexota bacterium]
MSERCHFCARVPAVRYALTVCDGPPDEAGAWRHESVPICNICRRFIVEAREIGAVFWSQPGRWYMGYASGRASGAG